MAMGEVSQIVQRLIEEESETKLLKVACLLGDIELVEYVLRAGLILRWFCHKTLRTPLHWACLGGHLNVVTLLLDHFDIDLPCKSGCTPLYLACSRGFVPIVCKLLQENASVNCYNSRGETPLSIACHRGHSKIAQILLGVENIQVNPKDGEGRSLLYWMSLEGKLDLVKLLLDHGAEVDVMTASHSTPLHVACFKGHRLVAKELIIRGANMEFRDDQHWTPLLYACHAGHVETIRVLLNHGADVNACTLKMRNSPLHIVCANGHTRAIPVLIQARVNVDAVNALGWTPLHFASYYCHVSTVEKLLEHHANVNAVTSQGNLALHIACARNNLDLVQTLLISGSFVNAVNSFGQTPRQHVKRSPDVFKLLQSYKNNDKVDSRAKTGEKNSKKVETA